MILGRDSRRWEALPARQPKLIVFSEVTVPEISGFCSLVIKTPQITDGVEDVECVFSLWSHFTLTKIVINEYGRLIKIVKIIQLTYVNPLLYVYICRKYNVKFIYTYCKLTQVTCTIRQKIPYCITIWYTQAYYRLIKIGIFITIPP